MKFTIEPYNEEKLEENRVTSYHIFKKGERRISDDYRYDDKGIFSYKIFGRIGSCRCLTGDKKTTPGYCQVCGTRVIDPNKMPFFYIDLEVNVPKLCTDYKKFPLAERLLTYKGFLACDDEDMYIIWEDKWSKKIALKDETGFEPDMDIICMYNVKTKDKYHEHIDFNLEKFCKGKKMLVGVEAVKKIYADKEKEVQEWLDVWTTDTVYIPHTSQRSNLKMNDGKVIISELNQLYTDLLYKIHVTDSYKMDYEYDEDGNNSLVVIDYYVTSYHSIYEAYVATSEKMLSLLTEGKKSYLNLNLRSHRVTSAIKGTVTNRFDLDEDVILVGDTFIQTMYPYLYAKCDGDMEAINKELIDNDELVLINRAPTICHLSIMAAKPRIASLYPFGTFDDGALGYPPYKSKDLFETLDEENAPEPEIDTYGIRTIAVNPMIFDGLAMDVDGDALFVIPIFSTQAKEEAQKMTPSTNFMNYANGEIRNGILEDIVYANEKLAKKA